MVNSLEDALETDAHVVKIGDLLDDGEHSIGLLAQTKAAVLEGVVDSILIVIFAPGLECRDNPLLEIFLVHDGRRAHGIEPEVEELEEVLLDGVGVARSLVDIAIHLVHVVGDARAEVRVLHVGHLDVVLDGVVDRQLLVDRLVAAEDGVEGDGVLQVGRDLTLHVVGQKREAVGGHCVGGYRIACAAPHQFFEMN